MPLSFAQQLMWVLQEMEPDSCAYNGYVARRLVGSLNISMLEQSLNKIIRRHEVLRTTFPIVDGLPVQVIAPALTLKLPLLSLQELPEAERTAQALHLVTEEIDRPFDLASGPLVRAVLLRLREDEHILVLVIHHIVSDGWSIGILLKELGTFYEALSKGEPSVLPKLPIQYADFAVWQRHWLKEHVLDSLLAYWKDRLEGLPMLQLPTDRPRPAVQEARGSMQFLSLPEPLTESLKTLSKQQGCNLFVTLLAAFKTLLHRYTGQEDIVVGTPVANRNHREIQSLIGCFVNPLVLRSDLSGNPSFCEMMSRVHDVVSGAYVHQDMPFERLVKELQPERDLRRSPLFQVWFNMVNLRDNQLRLPDVAVELFSVPRIHTKFDLTLYVLQQNKGIQLNLVYNTDIFEPNRMIEMLGQFRQLLLQLVECPEGRIAHFSLITPAAQLVLPNPFRTLHSEWAGAAHIRFSEMAQKLPENTAIVDRNEKWSYTQLDACSNRLASYLCASGIRPQDCVAIYGRRSALLVWAIIGVLKAGAAFAILDPAYPATRLIDCLRVAKPRGWIQLEAANELPPGLKECVATSCSCCSIEIPQHSITSVLEVLEAYSAHNSAIPVAPDNTAYIAFTSGSTGMPKGVLGTHRPLSHFLKWYCHTFSLNRLDRFSMLSGLCHDPLLRDIFTPLWLGATLCIPDPEEIVPGRLAEWMKQQEITVAHLTPAMEHILTTTKPQPSTDNLEITSLRYVFVGGDRLTWSNVARIWKLAPATTCVNFYGATETPQAVGYFIVPKRGGKNYEYELTSHKMRIPLGKGINDTQLLILNTAMQPAGISERGEIYVRSPYLAKGYVSDARLTAEKFLPDYFSNGARTRLYRSGDLGRYLPNGNVEFLGRIDRQVQIRGFRVELEEIEKAVSSYDNVNACLSVLDNERDIETMIAYIVCNEPVSSLSLRRYLKNKLPNYMIPSHFVQVNALPLTPNGKIDYGLLRSLANDQARHEKSYIPLQTPMQKQIAEIWHNVLGVDVIGLRDTFFDLGGHSLAVIRIMSQMRSKFGIAPSFRDFINHTFEEFVAACEEKMQ